MRAKDGGIGLDEGVALVADDGFGKGRAFEFGEVGFGVEEFELGGGSGHEEVNDGFGAGFDLRGFWFVGTGSEVIGEEGGGGDLAEANAAFAEEVAAGEWGGGHGMRFYRGSRRGAEIV